MEQTCTGHVAASTDLKTGIVTANFCKHHTGLRTAVNHLRLSSTLRLEIASMLQQGVLLSAIMDNLHDRATGGTLNSEINKRHVIVTTDLPATVDDVRLVRAICI